MKMEPVRIGVVGVGGFGSLHAHTLAGMSEAELVALVDRDEAKLRDVAKAHPDPGAWTDLREAIEKSKAEAWIIATPTASHIPIARMLLEAGKSVLIEKPMAANLTSAKSIESLVATNSRNVMLGHVVLFAPEFRQLVREIEQRGPVKYFHAVRHRGADHFDYFPGENPLRVTMVHDLYLAMVLTGGAEPTRMSARLHRRGDGRVDLALAEIEWPGRVWGSFTASFLTPPGMPKDGFDRMEVFGDGWAAQMRLNPRPIEVWGERAIWPMSIDMGMLAEELRCFCRVVRGIESVPLGARYADGLRLQHWLEQLERSAEM